MFGWQGYWNIRATLQASDLASRVQCLQQASFDSHQGPQSHAYQGVPLLGLLEQYGIQSEPKKAGGLLDRYLVATGADGYQAVFSAGELSPEVGQKDSLIATRLDDKAAAASVFYSTAPGDAKGGRYVANLVSLQIRAPSAAPDAEALQQGVVQISGALEKPLTLDAAALQAEPQTVLQLGSLDYGGVSLWTLLAEAGLKPDTSLKNLQCCRCSGWRKAMTAIG